MVVITLIGIFPLVFDKYLNAVKSLPVSYIELGYISDNKDNLGPFYHLDNNIIQY